MAKYAKNASGDNQFFVNALVTPGEYYFLDGIEEERRFAIDELFLQKVANGIAVMASDNTGTKDFNHAPSGYAFLLDIAEEDEEPEAFVGGLQAKRLKVFKYSKKFTIPDNITNLTIKNSGNNDVHLSFNNDRNDDYFTLESKDSTKIDQLTADKRVIRYKTSSGKPELEIIMWG